MKRVVILVFVTLIAVSILFMVYMVQNEKFDSPEPLDAGETHRILYQETVPREAVTSFQVTDSALIVYYDAAGLMNVYTLDGKFCYGIQIPVISNGYGDFIFHENHLYMMSRGNRMYIFRETELVKSFFWKEAPEEFAELEALVQQEKADSIGETQYYYLSETNKIAKTTLEDGMQTVIAFPRKNTAIYDATLLLLLLIPLFIHYLKHSKEKH